MPDLTHPALEKAIKDVKASKQRVKVIHSALKSKKVTMDEIVEALKLYQSEVKKESK